MLQSHNNIININHKVCRKVGDILSKKLLSFSIECTANYVLTLCDVFRTLTCFAKYVPFLPPPRGMKWEEGDDKQCLSLKIRAQGILPPVVKEGSGKGCFQHRGIGNQIYGTKKQQKCHPMCPTDIRTVKDTTWLLCILTRFI